MCGLTGFILNKKIDEPLAEKRLGTMVSTINHRGPDDQGVWTDGVTGLGFARLAIIDLSDAGHQPMSALNGKVWLTFNGEIYNFKSIRQELERLGHQFHSQSDSEVIIKGYLEWGESILSRLRGMFAIALWDDRHKRLLLARDRIGKKPLVYSQGDEGFFFGSEIKAILAWPGMTKETNLAALHQFLSYQYIPAPNTAFKAIKKLPAGHKLVIQLNSEGALGSIQIEPYWKLGNPRPRKSTISEPELIEELVHNLDEAVKMRMIADVPLGAFLSGGVDSSAIVAMMAKHCGQPIKTFSIGFEQDEYDETKYAQMVADRYATEHHVFTVKPNAVEILPKLIHHYNEPFADPSAIPSFYLAELARQHVTVALNGDGGDEAFIGYSRYSSMLDASKHSYIPNSLRQSTAAFLKIIPTPGWKKKRKSRFIKKIAPNNQAPQHQYAPTITAFSDQHKIDGYGEAMQEYFATSALDILSPYFDDADDLVIGANWADIHIYLPDDLMVKVDIATMAHSLESRSPLLDHVFMEWALTIPKHHLIQPNMTKSIFKKAMEPFLPKEVLYRPKMGFGCPVDHWLREELKEMAYDLLNSNKFLSRGIINQEFMNSLLDEHCNHNIDHSTRIWPLLTLELWYQAWIDK